ncbi:hypothetical protein [Arthrobacter sp. CJ23]|uniref:hypothetical protein n=1 Tax=Arthrobacter sp. CJ23 TaxID=2972479 RepID=UPI00215C34D0|nr:hypothetical protein [Arthrobacter sp. CJ23]UVJ38175.1 hypothetical protein NVV90_13025 [Arthrobacter sp. CJ23]
MRGNRIPVKHSMVLAAVLVLAATAGCTTEGKRGPEPAVGSSSNGSSLSGTPQPGSTTTAGEGSAPATSASPSDPSASVPGQAATATAWKTYTDPAKKVAFELPRDWIAQSEAPEAGSLPGAVKVVVKDAGGRYLGTLHTGMAAAAPLACPAGEGRPYVVINSVPMDLPHSAEAGTITPHAVFRVIQGYRFFGSYGITNMVAGADGQACELRNRVQGPAGQGDYFFGDLAAIHAFAADEKVAPAKSFDTLDQAAKYVEQSPEFANVQRMLLSLKVNL